MQLVTERLILREFEEADWEAVLAYQKDPLYLRYNTWEQRTPQDVQAFIGNFIAQQQVQPRIKFQWAVVTKAGMVVSSATRASAARKLTNARRRSAASLRRQSGARLRHRGRPRRRGLWLRGVGRASRLGVVHRGESRSARLEKLGMQLEGRLREKEYFKGRWWDALLYAVLEQEWRE